MRKGEDLDLQDETVWRGRRDSKRHMQLGQKHREAMTAHGQLPSDTSGVFEIWGSGWDSYATGPILFRFPKLPPEFRWDPLSAVSSNSNRSFLIVNLACLTAWWRRDRPLLPQTLLKSCLKFDPFVVCIPRIKASDAST